MKKYDFKLIGIIVTVVLAVLFGGIFYTNSFSNNAIRLEEEITTAISDIKVQEKARVDKVYNLADCVKQYSEHEASTLKEIAETRSNKDVLGDVNVVIKNTVEAYPELKSNDNYKTLMMELTSIENTLANHRKTYNKSVQRYNTYVKKFPNRIFLSLTGYEVNEYEKLDYEAPVDAPTNLFD